MSKKRFNYGGIYPKNIDGQWALRTIYHKDFLRTKIKGLFKIKCPEEWDIDYLLNLLCFEGYLCITDSPVGIMPFRCSLRGCNYMNNPTGVTIAVPYLPEMERTIGTDCELLFLERTINRTYFTYNPIIDIYAEKLASCDASIDVSLMTSRVSYIAEAETEGQSKTLKEIINKVTEGEPLVIYRKDTLSPNGMQVFFNNLKNNYIANDVEDTKRTILNEFLTDIGINNANTEKKERVIESEVRSNDDEIALNISRFTDCLKKNCEKINKMFNIDLSIEFKFSGRTMEDKYDIEKQYRNVENS